MTRILSAITLAAIIAASAAAEARRGPGAPVTPVLQPTNGWSVNATAHRGHSGRIVQVTCAPGGRPSSVWGSGIYTDDSSICTAAVHAGVITVARGGSVTIQIRGGLPSYRASLRHGIKSQPWRQWHGSFVVLGGTAGLPLQRVGPQPIRWTDDATALRGQNGSRHSFECPPQGRPASAWGTDRYTDDSSICTAACTPG